MIEAAIFDWGGVLAGAPASADRRRLERALGVRPGGLVGFFDSGPFFTMEEWIAVSGGRMAEDAFWRLVCRRFPVPPAPDLAAEAFEVLFLTPARPDVVALLRRVRERCPIALLSNATASLRRAAEPLELFDHVLISAELGVRKPAAQAFQAAVRALGADPCRTAFVDDADYNVAGARAAGLLAHQFRGTTGLRRWLGGLAALGEG